MNFNILPLSSFFRSQTEIFLIKKSMIDNVCILKQLTICFSNIGKNVIIFLFMWKTAIQNEFVVYLFGGYEILNVGRKSLNWMCHHVLSFMFCIFYQISITTQLLVINLGIWFIIYENLIALNWFAFKH